MAAHAARHQMRPKLPSVVLVAGAVIAALAGGAAGQPSDDGRRVDDPAVVEGLAWHLDQIGASTAWNRGLGTGIRVAVIDSGVDSTHPDLEHQVVESVSCIGADGDPERCQLEMPGTGAETHGTHVAGLIAARADDRIGVAGVAPRAELLVVRALQTSCPPGEACRLVGSTEDVAAGVRWATASGAQVINMSLTTPRLGSELEEALEEAWNAGVVPVLAAGPRSGAGNFLHHPPSVVVTATDRSGGLAGYAPFLATEAPGLAAPGGDDGDTAQSCRVGGHPVGLLSTAARTEGDGSGYACLSGTSMAAAVTSGSLAVLMSMGYGPMEALDRLAHAARPVPGTGAGAVDLAAATAEPHPAGIEATTDAFDTGAPAAEAVGATSGPFAGTWTGPEGDRPDLLVLLLAGIAVLLAGDLVLRVRSRRKAEAEVETAGE